MPIAELSVTVPAMLTVNIADTTQHRTNLNLLVLQQTFKRLLELLLTCIKPSSSQVSENVIANCRCCAADSTPPTARLQAWLMESLPRSKAMHLSTCCNPELLATLRCVDVLAAPSNVFGE